MTGLRNPCVQLDAFQPGLTAAVLDRDEHGELVRKAGVMSVVHVGGDVRPGDPIAVDGRTDGSRWSSALARDHAARVHRALAKAPALAATRRPCCARDPELAHGAGVCEWRAGRTWYRVSGDAGRTPLLCLHGGPGSTHHYFAPLERLAGERRVVLYDQLGCGRSPADGEVEWSLAPLPRGARRAPRAPWARPRPPARDVVGRDARARARARPAGDAGDADPQLDARERRRMGGGG